MADVLHPDRLLRAAERLEAVPGEPDAFFGALVDDLGRHGVSAVGACWHLADPETGLITWTGHTGELPGDFLTALRNEYADADVATYAEIAARRGRAGLVSRLLAETGGDPARSVRYREQLAPDGFADELRVVFADGYGRWGSLGLFSDRAFDAPQAAAVAALVPHVAATLRTAHALAAAPPVDAVPGVLVLDGADRVLTRDERAAELLAGCARTGALPGAVHVLAAEARAANGSARGRTLGAGGAWIAVDATPLVDAGGGVAVVLRPASAPSVLEIRLRAAGLTDREREIARAVLRGEDTQAIARTLFLSPWTVQDHLKAIFDKCGVRSRKAFAAHWAFRTAGVEA